MRRVLVFCCMAVLLVGCVTSAASLTLRNRTGATATAVTVAFSEAVTISGYNTAVFTTQEPKGKATSFRFSGGQLEDGGRFMISWLPSSAEIVDTQWEVPAAPAAAGPLTYEEIMAQIAHYPGPDEPLYVPAEGEQIWLTDLEGHADIYDNDSIKINYAPGFDKSQITKIEAYRNGVKMRFVPALFDVLTNEQMKTFDGVRAILPWSQGVHEQDSPKSVHVDHAIMGYTYALKLYAASSAAPISLSAHVRSGVTWHPKYVYAYLGSNWPHFISYFGLTPSQIAEYMAHLRAAGFTGVSVDYNLFVDSLSGNEVLTQDDKPEYLTTMYGIWVTPTLAQYELMLSSARQAGLEFELRGHIYTSERWAQANPGGWAFSGDLAPTSANAFLDSLFAKMKPVLELCERYGVERTDILTEMDTLEREGAAIKTFLDKVARVFSGEIGIETVPSHFDGMYNRAASFWDWTDGARHLAINYSLWVPPIEDQRDQRLSVMVDRFVEYWQPTHDYYRRTYPDSDICWGEIGTYPVDGVATGPDYFYNLDLSRAAINDIQEFNDSYAAFLLASKALGMDGMCVWFVSLCDVESLNVYKSSIFTDSSTMALISSIIEP